MTWYDPTGGLHLKPNPDYEQSENAPMYSGCEIVMLCDQGKLTIKDCDRFINYVERLYDGKDWKTTPFSDQYRMSLDNWTGIICGLYCIYNYYFLNKWGEGDRWYTKRIEAIVNCIPTFHKQLDHPKDFFFVNYMKYKILGDNKQYLFWLGLWITSFAMTVSCWQTHKKRTIPKTDGKILALMRCKALGMAATWKVCDFLVKEARHDPPYPDIAPYLEIGKYNTVKSWKWGQWKYVFFYYFKREDHPLVKLAIDMDS